MSTVLCTRHSYATILHRHSDPCPLCATEEALSLARTDAELERRKRHIAEGHLSGLAGRVSALPLGRVLSPEETEDLLEKGAVLKAGAVRESRKLTRAMR